MIFGNLEFAHRYNFLNDKIQKCITFIKENDLKSFEVGSHAIDGDNIFVNIVEYTTTTPENRFWEAHKTYIDLHIIFNGEEQIDLNFIHNMTEKAPYDAEKEMILLDGVKNTSVQLVPNDFLILYPEDAHCTGVQVNEPTFIKKAIFKIKVD